MRIILVAALATMMCAPAGLAQTAKEKSPQATASSQRQLSPAERVRWQIVVPVGQQGTGSSHRGLDGVRLREPPRVGKELAMIPPSTARKRSQVKRRPLRRRNQARLT